jgi:hypothetical protein
VKSLPAFSSVLGLAGAFRRSGGGVRQAAGRLDIVSRQLVGPSFFGWPPAFCVVIAEILATPMREMGAVVRPFQVAKVSLES